MAKVNSPLFNPRVFIVVPLLVLFVMLNTATYAQHHHGPPPPIDSIAPPPPHWDTTHVHIDSFPRPHWHDSLPGPIIDSILGWWHGWDSVILHHLDSLPFPPGPGGWDSTSAGGGGWDTIPPPPGPGPGGDSTGTGGGWDTLPPPPGDTTGHTGCGGGDTLPPPPPGGGWDSTSTSGGDSTGHHLHADMLGTPVVNTNTVLSQNGIFPNPVSSTSTLHIQDTKSTVTFILYQTTGQKVMERTNLTNGNFDFNKGNLAPGYYFYQLIDGSNLAQTGKILIQ